MERDDKDKDKVEGEGSYTGTKDYNQRTKKFIDSGKVDEAAHDAEPKSEEEKQRDAEGREDRQAARKEVISTSSENPRANRGARSGRSR